MKWALLFVWLLALGAVVFASVVSYYAPEETCRRVCRERGYDTGRTDWRWRWCCYCRSERGESFEIP